MVCLFYLHNVQLKGHCREILYPIFSSFQRTNIIHMFKYFRIWFTVKKLFVQKLCGAIYSYCTLWNKKGCLYFSNIFIEVLKKLFILFFFHDSRSWDNIFLRYEDVQGLEVTAFFVTTSGCWQLLKRRSHQKVIGERCWNY